MAGVDFAPTIFDALGIDPIAGMDGRSVLPVLKAKLLEMMEASGDPQLAACRKTLMGK